MNVSSRVPELIPATARLRFALFAFCQSLALGCCSCSATELQGEKFSFFVTSLPALQDLSGRVDGFGGDLSFGEIGPGAGLRGADIICAAIAEKSLPGSGSKPWRAFLSSAAGENGQPVHAIDRIGGGPWYDRLGRLLAATRADLLGARPRNGDAAIQNDFPNEAGAPNRRPLAGPLEVNNYAVLTGSTRLGTFYSAAATCRDWTSATGDTAYEGRPRVGYPWRHTSGEDVNKGDNRHGPGGQEGASLNSANGVAQDHWMSAHDASGCAPGVNRGEKRRPQERANTVGAGGGYGAIYCFSLTP